MNTLFHAEICDRDFKSHLLYVPDLIKWLDANGLHIASQPPFSDFKYIQVEALLCAIERQAGDIPHDQALEIVAADDSLKADRMADSSPAWLIGAEAHRKWRVIINQAVTDGELSLLDFGSNLPIETHGTPAAKVGAVLGIGKKDVMAAFYGLKWDYDHWGKNLASPSNKLKDCRVVMGSKRASALWNPADIAVYLLDEGVSLKKLDAVFVSLNDWADEWREKTALLRD